MSSAIRQGSRIGRAQRAPSESEGRGPWMARVNLTLSARWHTKGSFVLPFLFDRYDPINCFPSPARRGVVVPAS
jgi:hypothetical protein